MRTVSTSQRNRKCLRNIIRHTNAVKAAWIGWPSDLQGSTASRTAVRPTSPHPDPTASLGGTPDSCACELANAEHQQLLPRRLAQHPEGAAKAISHRGNPAAPPFPGRPSTNLATRGKSSYRAVAIAAIRMTTNVTAVSSRPLEGATYGSHVHLPTPGPGEEHLSDSGRDARQPVAAAALGRATPAFAAQTAIPTSRRTATAPRARGPPLFDRAGRGECGPSHRRCAGLRP